MTGPRRGRSTRRGLLDTFVVRKFLIPALIVWVGPASAWPSRRLRPARGSVGS